MLSRFSCVQFFATLWTVACFCLWDSPGKNTGVGCHFLLQGIFPTQGSILHQSYVSRIGRWFFAPSIIWEAHDNDDFSSKASLGLL